MIWRALTRQKTPAPGQPGWPVLYAAARSGKRSVRIAPLPSPRLAAAVTASEDGHVVATRARSSWARLIHKVYEVDPLVYAKCGAPMHVIALIDDATVIRRILEHLGRWAPRQARKNQRAPPVDEKGIDGLNPPVRDGTYHPLCAAVHKGCNAELIVMRSRLLQGPDCRSF